MPATIASLTHAEVEQRLDFLIGEVRKLAEHSDKDVRAVLLQYVFGPAWDELGPDDDRWTAAEFVISGHLYGRHPAVGLVQRSLVEAIHGIEQGIAAVDGEAQYGAEEITRRAEAFAEQVAEWAGTVDFSQEAAS
jgi:hypothetical protein